jgi:ribosomal protein S18 acetylase RimI-like enzyme
MWVNPEWRGAGLAPTVAPLEAVAVELGYETVRLDTNGTLTDAIALYERAGYRRIARYNDLRRNSRSRQAGFEYRMRP